MSLPEYNIADAIILSLTTAAATVITPIVIHVPPNSDLVLLLVPLIGALIASSAGILLNPKTETRPIVIGRSLIALVFGCAGPQLIGEVSQKFDASTIKPIFLLLGGFLFATVAYLLSRAFFTQAYARADLLAKKAVDEIERRAGIQAHPKDHNDPSN